MVKPVITIHEAKMGIGSWVRASGSYSEKVRESIDPAQLPIDLAVGSAVTFSMFIVDFSSGSAALADALGVLYPKSQAVDVGLVDMQALGEWCRSHVYRPQWQTEKHFRTLIENGFHFTYETE